MTQEAIELRTTGGAYPGVAVLQDTNKALATVATDFAGPADPAALAGPHMTWADTGTGTRKRRNAANTAWVVEGRLFVAHMPIIPLADVPTNDIGPIHIIGVGPAEWSGTAYKAMTALVGDMQWLGTPIGGYITPYTAPPKDDPRFRYVLCTAGQTGAGGYNEGVLTDESVTGTAPLVMASAKVSLASSPMKDITIPLIDTEGRFVGAGAVGVLEDDMFQMWEIGLSNGSFANLWPVAASSGSGDPYTVRFQIDAGDSNSLIPTSHRSGAYGTPRVGNHTQPRTHRLPHYRRIL